MYHTAVKKAGLIAATMTLMFTSIQCSLQNPVAPSWEADINVPLLTSNIFISDFTGLEKPGSKDPFAPVILGATCITGEVREVGVSALTGIVNNGVVNYDLENRLAIGLDTAVIYISRDPATVYQAPEVVIGPLHIEAAEVDGAGNVIQAKSTQINITLTESEMAVLANESGIVYVGYYLVTSGTNGLSVNIQPTDYLKTSLLVSVKTKVN
jgi:hypothetical protein